MRLLNSLFTGYALLVSASHTLAASWTFTDGTISVQSKGTGVGGSRKEKSAQILVLAPTDADVNSLTPGKLLSKSIDLGATDTLKIILTTQEGKTAKRPHQAFLLLQDTASNLDVSYPLSIKESGKAKLDLVCHRRPTSKE